MLVFSWEDCLCSQVPTTENLVADNRLCERLDCVGQVAESEVAAMYEDVHNRQDNLANSNGESMEEPRRVRAEGGL